MEGLRSRMAAWMVWICWLMADSWSSLRRLNSSKQLQGKEAESSGKDSRMIEAHTQKRSTLCKYETHMNRLRELVHA